MAKKHTTSIVEKTAADLVAGDHDVDNGIVIAAVTLMNGDVLVAYDIKAQVQYKPDQKVRIEVES